MTKELLRTIAEKTLALEQNNSTLDAFADMENLTKGRKDLKILGEEKANLEKLKNELQFELYGKERKKKKGDNSYRRKRYYEGKHREKFLLQT